ncbi:helix-turn-helix domain-containing protein [Azospirillum tabaci]|uniref:helix-turn-helix domain-containing protein n=1 Tax=Azospirillum tabaci TaxID=2752310 RepID=UPI001660A9F4|nr:helix-turn-helix transcriptional regulator [Azospirillum tabaci]
MSVATLEQADALSSKAFGIRLESARIALGLTAEDMQELFGVTKGTYSGYIHGRFYPGPDKLYALVQKGISVDWLYYGIDTALTVKMANALSGVSAEAAELIANPQTGRRKAK